MASGNVYARDLVGVRGTVLPDDQILSLPRVTRLSPETYLAPEEPEPDTETPTVELDEPSPEDVPVPEALATGLPVQLDPMSDEPAPSELSGITAEEIEALGGDRPGESEAVIAEPPQPDIEEVELASLENDIDVSSVEMFDPDVYAVPEGVNLEEEFYDSSLFSRQTGPDLPLPDGSPPPGQSSAGLSGYFAGVASAERMVLLLDVRKTDIFGLFADSAAQEFSIRGELLSPQGQARLVLFANEAVGVLEVQLTTLGLSTVFIPLGEDGLPDAAATRSYDFVRVLSPEARRALEDLRLANIDRREAAIRAAEEIEANRRLQFPGDNGSFD